MLKFHDERDLQRKIARKLSSKGPWQFQVMPANYWCDIADRFHNIYIEVKVKGRFAAAQLLYGSVVGVKSPLEYKPQYFGLATPSECRFYKAPDFEIVEAFARKISPDKSLPPSKVPRHFDQEALELLGEPVTILTDYDKELNLQQPYVFITLENLEYVKQLLEKYGIDIKEFLAKFSDVWINGGQILPLKKGGLTDTIDGSVLKCKPIRSKADADLILHLRVTPSDLDKISHALDRLEQIPHRRELGKFYTKPKVANEVHDIISSVIKPDVIVEPYAGTGSLLLPFDENIPLIINDIDREAVEIATILLKGRNVKTDTVDVFGEHTADDLINRWGLKGYKEILVYSNPPFGTKSTNRLAGRREQKTIKIKIHETLEKYGKRDLCLPAIGQMLELAKRLNAVVGSFMPFGVILGRKSYLNLLKEIAHSFEFIWGKVYRGESFNDVSKRIPVLFLLIAPKGKKVKKPARNGSRTIRLVKSSSSRWMLLKDGWRYDRRDAKPGEVSVPCTDRFNAAGSGSNFFAKPSSGSAMESRNVKIDIGFEEVPAELVYGLWSIVVGSRGVIQHPYPFEQAHVHILRDFQSSVNAQEILVLALLWAIIEENLNANTNGLIGFTGTYHRLRFGNPATTRGARYLLEKFKDMPLCDNVTVKDFVEILAKNELDTGGYRPFRAAIREQISRLLDEIGYWDQIVVPDETPDEVLEWEIEVEEEV